VITSRERQRRLRSVFLAQLFEHGRDLEHGDASFVSLVLAAQQCDEELHTVDHGETSLLTPTPFQPPSSMAATTSPSTGNRMMLEKNF
jgi:hypothetical protein